MGLQSCWPESLDFLCNIISCIVGLRIFREADIGTSLFFHFKFLNAYEMLDATQEDGNFFDLIELVRRICFCVTYQSSLPTLVIFLLLFGNS
jgi:hypothetical protein